MASPAIGTTERPLRIGDLAARTGVSVEALRYYEQRGLIHPLGRRESGYREYSSDSVKLVRFIKRAQGLGFTLAEVEELVQLRARAWAGDAPWKLRDAAVTKLRDVARRIRELSALRTALTEMITACDASCKEAKCDETVPCGLVEAFDTSDDETTHTSQERIAQ
jgi:DNA-binding transcriptional MerR regulator